MDFESYCQKARDIVEVMDDCKWMLGEMAAGIETRYRGHTMEAFAIQINYEKRRIYEYAQVWAFYEKCAEAHNLKQSPVLRWTHFRDAMRLMSLESMELKGITDFLEDCIGNLWTVEQARLELQRILGKPTQAVLLFECEDTESAIRYLKGHPGRYTIKIYDRVSRKVLSP
jgi:hypothetical protein